MKRILIVTGQSGSGKSSALQVLEDLGYYCIDNLPLALLPEIVAKLDHENNLEQLALGVDIRSTRADMQEFDHVFLIVQKHDGTLAYPHEYFEYPHLRLTALNYFHDPV